MWSRSCCKWCTKWTWLHQFKIWTRLLAFHIALIHLGKAWIQIFTFQSGRLKSLTWLEQPVSSSSSSCRVTSADQPDPFLPSLSITHRFHYVFKAKSCISTVLFYVGSCWSSCLCSSMWWGPLEYVAFEFVPTSPAASYMSGSSNLDSFRDGW